MLAVGDIFTVINIAMQNQILAVVINSAQFSYFLSFPSSSLEMLSFVNTRITDIDKKYFMLNMCTCVLRYCSYAVVVRKGGIGCGDVQWHK